MTEIDITRLVRDEETWGFSGSIATHGANAAPNTWRAALNGPRFLTTPEHCDAMRAWARDTGAWNDEEVAAWSETECNALFLQLVTGDMRECGLEDSDPDEFDWDEYQIECEAGQYSSRLYRADDGTIWFSLAS